MRKIFAVLISLIILISASIGIFTAVKSTDWYKDKFDKSTEIVEDSSTSSPSEDTGEGLDYESAYNKLIEDANGYTIKYERTQYSLECFYTSSTGKKYCRSLEIDKYLDSLNSPYALDEESVCFIKSILNKEVEVITISELELYTFSNGLISQKIRNFAKSYNSSDFNLNYNAELVNLSDIDLENFTYDNQCFYSYFINIIVSDTNVTLDLNIVISNDGQSLIDYFNSINN